jgi:hypothetical protein
VWVGENTVAEVKNKTDKISVVEDDEASRTIIARILNQRGFSKIIQAENSSCAK